MSFISSAAALGKKGTTWVVAHKIISGIVLMALLAGGYFGYQALFKESGTRTVVSAVKKGNVSAVVSGSGQISAENQVALSAKTSGEITSVNVVAGQAVHKGQTIASIDLGNAGFELQSAQLEYQKVATQYPADASKAKVDAENAHVQAHTALVTASTDMQTALDTDHDVVNGYLHFNSSVTKSQAAETYITTAEKSYVTANTAVKAFLKDYQTLGDSNDAGKIATTFASARTATMALLQASKDTRDAVAYTRDRSYGNPSEADSAYSSMNSVVTDTTSILSTLASSLDDMQTADQTLASYDSGVGSLDVRSQQLALAEKQDAYNDHFVTAPFDGVIAKVSAKVGDQAGSSTEIATIITKEQLAEITMNEVDVAKVKTGQKATLTFDAIDGLTLQGTVAEVEGIGTVSQGVVSYGVKIGLDAQDDRVRPGMTVNVDIETASATDVLVLPASAVKTMNGKSYVDAVDTSKPTDSKTGMPATKRVYVTTGITDDTNIEIVSGLTEGEQVVVRTTAATSTTKRTTTGTTGATGGAVRFGGGAAAGGFQRVGG